MSPPTRRLLLWSATLVLGVAVCTYLGWRVEWSAFARLTLTQLSILLISTLVLIGLHALGAAALLRGLGFRTGLRPVLTAMLAASTVSLAGDPKLGVPARLALYRLLAGVPLRIGTTATLVESLLWMLLMGAIVAVPGPLAAGYALPLSLFAAATVAGAIALVAFGPGLFERLWLLGPLLRRLGAVRRFVLDVRKAILGISPFWLAIATLWLAMTYLVDVWSIWFLADALGTALHPIAVSHAIVISYLAGAASLLPLGLGVRDGAFALLLERAGAPADVAALIALLHRTLRTVLPLVLGFIVSLAILRRYRNAGAVIERP
ncbi:lysylphosphatidylglycerol synthase domain-containing protein [Bradyrhizobium sp. sBnM-33]|uniref:lysylphosphatidylglycerol synthase domain-containing protein n=2 Tax=unclassified Bradyrhizobium TaxID=2631580 RepID=UPI001BCFD80C|nr:lysylphosphatidylglycerol synthase domain-containing protein [Bradyrhizobium sp. sBnM-33]WOH48819.1 lysylphosphatidylglycerol synthase domain-containing protein [Bradyrhizobium sp. sBnM-33]